MPTYVLVGPVDDLLLGYLQKYAHKRHKKQNQNVILLYIYIDVTHYQLLIDISLNYGEVMSSQLFHLK
jgi:hypothetical protein